MLLLLDELAVAPHPGAHLVGRTLLERVEIEEPGFQCIFGSVRAEASLGRVQRLRFPRKLLALVLAPVAPGVVRGERVLVVDHERAARVEVLEEAAQRLGVTLAIAPQPEAAADEDRLVGARRVELVHRLHEEGRREPCALRLLAADRDHVAGDVTTVDVEPGEQEWDEQSPGAAGDVESRLAALDVLLEVGDLRPVLGELGPPLRHEPVVPGRRGVRCHGCPPRLVSSKSEREPRRSRRRFADRSRRREESSR